MVMYTELNNKNLLATEHFTKTFTNENIPENGLTIFSESEGKVTIDSFQLSGEGNSSGIFPRLHVSTGSNSRTLSKLATTGRGGNIWDPTYLYIENYGNPYLETTLYDTDNSQYKMQNKRPIIMPEGGKLAIYSNETFNDKGWRCHVSYTVEKTQ